MLSLSLAFFSLDVMAAQPQRLLLGLPAPLKVTPINVFTEDKGIYQNFITQVVETDIPLRIEQTRPISLLHNCRSISKSYYQHVIHRIIRKLTENNPVFDCEVRTNKVISHIYDAADNLHATPMQLIEFTTIAMHNMFLFQKFSPIDSKCKSLTVNRGLLQIQTPSFYKELSHYSKFDYCKMPYYLNEFNRKSIYDEFRYFKHVSIKHNGGIKSISKVMQYFEIADTEVLNIRKEKIKKGAENKHPENVAAMQRRMFIFNNLVCRLFQEGIRRH